MGQEQIKKIKGKVIFKHETAADWDKSEYIPDKGEQVFYDIDENHNYVRVKHGNGVDKVKDLPFFKSESVLPVTAGSAKNSIIINEGNADGINSIAGGTSKKEDLGSLGNIIGNSLTKSTANGAMSVAYGGGNNALSTNTLAIGFNNQAGVKGYYWSDITLTGETDSNGNKSAYITLSKKQNTLDGVKIDELDWQVDDYISIVNGGKYPYCAQITKIETLLSSVETVRITVNKSPFTNDSTSFILKPDDKTIFAVSRKLENGDYNIIVRNGLVELGWGAAVVGLQNYGLGSFSHTTGYNNLTAGDFGFASGRNNIVGYAALASGDGNNITGRYAAGVGLENRVWGMGAFAAGNASMADANWSASFGFKTHAMGKGSMTIGDSTLTRKEAEYSLAAGIGTWASAPGQTVIGKYNKENKEAAFVIGNGTSNSSRSNAVEIDWDGNTKFGTRDIDGKLTKGGHIDASSVYVLGDIIAGGAISAQEDIRTTGDIYVGVADTPKKVATEDYVQNHLYGLTQEDFSTIGSISCEGGLYTVGDVYVQENKKVATEEYVNNSYVTAGRKADTIVGENSTAEGKNNEASGNCSHAEGEGTKATGNYSHAEGAQYDSTKQTIAGGDYSHAEGCGTKATKSYAHSEGILTEATGEAAHAEGYLTKATGARAHSEGWFATASGQSSHAEGEKTVASGQASHASGYYTKATTLGQMATGKWNETNSNALFIVGNGTKEDEKDENGNVTTKNRSNAFEVISTNDGVSIKVGNTILTEEKLIKLIAMLND